MKSETKMIKDRDRTDGVEGEDYVVLNGQRYYYIIDPDYGKVLPAAYRMHACTTAEYATFSDSEIEKNEEIK